MRLKHTISIFLVLLLLGTVSTSADMLFLRDGDRLTGALAGIADGTLTFRTKLAGTIFVPLDEVEGITTTHFVLVALGPGRLVPGRLRYQSGQTYLVSQNRGEEWPIDLGAITEVTAMPASGAVEAETGASSKDSPVQVSLGTGYRWRTGTEDHGGPFVEAEVSGRGEKAGFSGRVRLEYLGDEGDFDRFYEARARVRVGPEDKWRPEIGVELERDADKALDFRGELTLGLVRNLVDSDEHELEAVVGLGVSTERWDADLLSDSVRGHGRGSGGKHRDEELNLNLSFRYTKLLFSKNGKNASLREELILRPSLTDPGDLRAQLESALFMPLTPWMKLKLEVLVDYEDDTRYRVIDEWNTAVGASVRFDF